MARRRRPGLRGKLRRTLDRVASLTAMQQSAQATIDRLRSAYSRDAIDAECSERVMRYTRALREDCSAESRRADDAELSLGYANGEIETANERVTALFVWSSIATVLVGLLAAFAAVLTLYVIDLRHELTVQAHTAHEVPVR